MAGTAIEEHQNAGIGPWNAVLGPEPLAGRQHVRQGQIQGADGPDLQHVPASDPHRALTSHGWSHRSCSLACPEPTDAKSPTADRDVPSKQYPTHAGPGQEHS